MFCSSIVIVIRRDIGNRRRSMKADETELDKPSFWQLVFAQSKVNGAHYIGDSCRARIGTGRKIHFCSVVFVRSGGINIGVSLLRPDSRFLEWRAVMKTAPSAAWPSCNRADHERGPPLATPPIHVAASQLQLDKSTRSPSLFSPNRVSLHLL